jgi:hypothetical protein
MHEANLLNAKKKYKGNNILLHFDGANNSTNFKDEYGRTFVRNGSPYISTTQSKFGGSSAFFNYENLLFETNDQIVLAGDYTVECYIYRTGANPSGYMMPLISNRIGTARQIPMALGPDPNTVAMWLNTTGIVVVSVPLYYNAWQHFASTREGEIHRLFVDGKKVLERIAPVESVTMDAIFTWTGITSYSLCGYADEFRVDSNVAYYKADFTPPAAPFLF